MQCPMLVMMMDDQSLLVQWQILTPLLLASKNSLVYTSLSPFSVFNFHLFLPSYSLVIRTQYYKVYQSMEFFTILRAKRATLRDLIRQIFSTCNLSQFVPFVIVLQRDRNLGRANVLTDVTNLRSIFTIFFLFQFEPTVVHQSMI